MELKKVNNNSLTKAKSAKKDEFYTQLPDIERELGHYKKHFKDKVIFCNCDDPKESNFFKYFALNFKFLGLKKLISTHYNKGNNSYKLEVTKDINNDGIINLDDAVKTDLKGDGDFRSDECIEILKEADIVVTNPPFSLFREYVAQLVENKKNFIIIGSLNAITYKDIFQLIKENELWIGYGFKAGNAYFSTTHETNEFATGVYNKETNLVKFRNVTWYTNIEIAKRNEDIILYKSYKNNENDYPKYDNYDAINVGKVAEIPLDYDGAMGVPISFLNNHNPNQFEICALGIVGSIDFTSNKKMEILDKNSKPTGKFTFNAKGTLYKKHNPSKDKRAAFRDVETNELYSSIYARIIIKNKRLQNGN